MSRLDSLLLRSSALPLDIAAERHPCREFGWFWEVSDDVDFLTGQLSVQKNVIYVWDTPQFRAVEWLIGEENMEFPATFDHALHGVFCRILSIEATCRSPLLHGDILKAIEQIQKASKKLIAAADDLNVIHENVLTAVGFDPYWISNRLNGAQREYSELLGDMEGIFTSDIRYRTFVKERFGGPVSNKEIGRPHNWVASFIAQHAADIYRTAYPGEITRGRGKPSFAVFLEKFAESYPDAERADIRALARTVWSGHYPGKPFIPEE